MLGFLWSLFSQYNFGNAVSIHSFSMRTKNEVTFFFCSLAQKKKNWNLSVMRLFNTAQLDKTLIFASKAKHEKKLYYVRLYLGSFIFLTVFFPSFYFIFHSLCPFFFLQILILHTFSAIFLCDSTNWCNSKRRTHARTHTHTKKERRNDREILKKWENEMRWMNRICRSKHD